MSRRLSPNQKLFNKVVRHLRKQGEKSIDSNGYCVYRGPRKLRCAIGAVIPNRLYRPEMEHKSVHSNIISNCLRTLGYDTYLTHFLIDMQDIHDLCHPSEWEVKFQEYAQKYHLTIPPIRK